MLVAFYLYLVPFFSIKRFALPFLAIIFFAAIEPKGVFFALVFAATFYLILGIKDLIFVERKPAYEVLVLLLVFFSFINFFSNFGSWNGLRPFLCVFIVGVFVFLLLAGFLNYGGKEDGLLSEERLRRGKISAAIAGLVVSQITIALLFLPLNYLYQSALAFLVALSVVELLSDYLAGGPTRRAVLINLSVFLAFAVIILGSANWAP